MLKLENINITFNKNTANERKALQHIDLDVADGDFVTVIGSNGAGKSTLLRVISGIYRPDSGSVTIDGKAVYDQPQAKENIFFVSDEKISNAVLWTAKQSAISFA